MTQSLIDRDRTTEMQPVDASSSGRYGQTQASPGTSGWMWVWVTIGILVLLVVIGFLIPTVQALDSIDDALTVADEAVTGAGGDVEPLPSHIETINSSLTNIDESLQPIGGQADEIIASLSSINGALTEVDSSLATTSGTLSGTSSGLEGTSATLADVEGLAGSIRNNLETTQASPDGLGTEHIWQRVDVANATLGSILSDTGNIVPQLEESDRHLMSICNSVPTGAVAGPCN